jgi:hypothetical protein
MKEIVKKLSVMEVKTLMDLMKLSATKGEGSGLAPSQVMKLDLSSIDLKLDGPDMYLSWSHKIEAALVGKRFDRYLTGAKVEPASNNVEKDEWKTTHDIWVKLKRTYAGAENHMRVFQIQRDIEEVVQGLEEVTP